MKLQIMKLQQNSNNIFGSLFFCTYPLTDGFGMIMQKSLVVDGVKMHYSSICGKNNPIVVKRGKDVPYHVYR